MAYIKFYISVKLLYHSGAYDSMLRKVLLESFQVAAMLFQSEEL